MKLRMRLALTTLAVAAPMLLALFVIDAVARHRAAEARLADLARGYMQAQRERCEADPASWGGELSPPGRGGPHDGPPRGGPRSHDGPHHDGPHDGPHGGPREGQGGAPPVVHAYDASMRSQNPAAPEVPAALAASESEVATRAWGWWRQDVEVVVRMPWDTGPCARVLARGTTVPGWLGAILPATPTWLAPLVGLLAVVLLAMGPILRRIRRLTEAVQRSASEGYAGAVELDGRDELAELARAFDAAGRRVREQLAEKDRREQALRRFLADTTHDVMIPLTVLQGHLSALRERADRLIDVPTLTAAMDEAHYLAALVHNLAVVARLDAGELRLQRGPVDLGALVERVVLRHRAIARQLAVTVERAVPEAPVIADADVTLIEQAVSNIVYNAVRHHRAQGHVAVILETSTSATGERFRLRVVDDGPGMSAAELTRIAERGFRGDAARTRAPEGQGLGLDIAHRVAALHGLELRFAASEFGGLQVDLTGPITG